MYVKPAKLCILLILQGLLFGQLWVFAENHTPPADRFYSCEEPGQELSKEELKEGVQIPVHKTIKPAHRAEWRSSAVDDSLIDLNVMSLPLRACDAKGQYLSSPVADYLGWDLKTLPVTPPMDKNGDGWLFRGLDPITLLPLQGGQVKLDLPIRRSTNKYEDPFWLRGANRLMLFKLPTKIVEKLKVAAPLESTLSAANFWTEVRKDANYPMLIAEGAKKAGSLLSAGYISVATAGVVSGLKRLDDFGRPIEPSLVKDFDAFQLARRDVTIAFDHDTEPETIAHVKSATYHLGRLLSERGAKVFILLLPGPEKGVDDLIAAKGTQAIHAVFAKRQPFEIWSASNVEAQKSLRLDVAANETH